MIGKYCIVRTYSAGVHAGVLTSKDGKEVSLTNSRRIWLWDGYGSPRLIVTKKSDIACT